VDLQGGLEEIEFDSSWFAYANCVDPRIAFGSQKSVSFPYHLSVNIFDVEIVQRFGFSFVVFWFWFFRLTALSSGSRHFENWIHWSSLFIVSAFMMFAALFIFLKVEFYLTTEASKCFLQHLLLFALDHLAIDFEKLLCWQGLGAVINFLIVYPVRSSTTFFLLFFIRDSLGLVIKFQYRSKLMGLVNFPLVSCFLYY